MSKKELKFRPASFSACRPGQTVAEDWYTFQCAVAVMLDAMGIDPDMLRTEDKDSALDEDTNTATERGHEKVREIVAYFHKRLDNLDPYWRKRGEPMKEIDEAEWDGMDLYDHWCEGDLAAKRPQGRLSLNVEAVRLFAKRFTDETPTIGDLSNCAPFRRMIIPDINKLLCDKDMLLQVSPGVLKPLSALWNELRSYANESDDFRSYEPKIERTLKPHEIVKIDDLEIAWRSVQTLGTDMNKRTGTGREVWKGVPEKYE